MLAKMLPLFPLQSVLFPGMVLPLHIFEPRYRRMFADHHESDPMFGVVLTRSGNEVGEQPEIHNIGTAATLLKAIRYEDGRVDLAVRGARRFRVHRAHWDHGYLMAAVDWLPDKPIAGDVSVTSRIAQEIQEAFHAYLAVLARMTGQSIAPPDLGGEPTEVAYAVCTMMPFGVAVSQRLLEADAGMPLQHQLLSLLRHERALLEATGIGGNAIHHPGRRFSAN